MESSKYVNPAEPASPDHLPPFLREFEEEFSREMALQLEPLDDYMCGLDYLVAPLSPSDLFDDPKSEIEPQVEELEPEVPVVSPIPTTLDTPPATPGEEAGMETDECSEEDVQGTSTSAATPCDESEEPCSAEVEMYRALLDVNEDGSNKYERLLASMPKSNAGRKRKSVTTNMSRNALAARENRDRKKEYTEELEENIRELADNYKKVLKVLAKRESENRSLRRSLDGYKKMFGATKSSALQREG